MIMCFARLCLRLFVVCLFVLFGRVLLFVLSVVIVCACGCDFVVVCVCCVFCLCVVKLWLLLSALCVDICLAL